MEGEQTESLDTELIQLEIDGLLTARKYTTNPEEIALISAEIDGLQIALKYVTATI